MEHFQQLLGVPLDHEQTRRLRLSSMSASYSIQRVLKHVPGIEAAIVEAPRVSVTAAEASLNFVSSRTTLSQHC